MNMGGGYGFAVSRPQNFVRVCAFFAVLSLLLSVSTSAWAYGYIHRATFLWSPSKPPDDKGRNEEIKKIRIIFGCYNADSGSPVRCPLTYKLTGVKTPESDVVNNGGHFHSADRPLTYNYNLSPEAYDAASKTDLELFTEYDVDEDPTKYGVKTTTMGHFPKESDYYGTAVIEYEVPQVSGVVIGEAEVRSPQGWYCVRSCYTETTTRYRHAFEIGFRGLQELPTPREDLPFYTNYTKSRKPDDAHTDAVAFYGSGHTLLLLPLVANQYRKFSGRNLSVNDMSLPKGGLFDYQMRDPSETPWITGHDSHRKGRDADINREGINCEIDQDLDDAAQTVTDGMDEIGSTLNVTRLCEPGGLKHLDFEF